MLGTNQEQFNSDFANVIQQAHLVCLAGEAAAALLCKRSGCGRKAGAVPTEPAAARAVLPSVNRPAEYIVGMEDHQQDSALLSVQQAADVLCVSASTVQRWIADGTLPARRAPDRRINAEDVGKLLRSQVWVTPFSTEIWPTA